MLLSLQCGFQADWLPLIVISRMSCICSLLIITGNACNTGFFVSFPCTLCDAKLSLEHAQFGWQQIFLCFVAIATDLTLLFLIGGRSDGQPLQVEEIFCQSNHEPIKGSHCL